MTHFRKHLTFTVSEDAQIKRRTGELPAAVKLPAVSVSVASDADLRATARLRVSVPAEVDQHLACRDDMVLYPMKTPNLGLG